MVMVKNMWGKLPTLGDYVDLEEGTTNWDMFGLPECRGKAEVSAFAEKMLETMNLPKNASKGDWKSKKWIDLYHGLQEEVSELFFECMQYEHYDKSNEIRKKIRNEAADVAIFAMMLADKLGRED